MSSREALGKLTEEELDGLVHDLKSHEAASINNAGKEAQVNFLLAKDPQAGLEWVKVCVRGGVVEIDKSSGICVEVLDYDNDGCDCVPDGDTHSHEVFER